jgi:hypothetical protein
MAETDVAIERLEDQIGWYDRKSRYNQQMFKWMKTGTIAFSLAIPLWVAFGTYKSLDGRFVALVSAVVVATIALFEAIQQLNQYHSNWITYRSTAEHEIIPGFRKSRSR